jgi:hypothetical protein
MRTNDLRRAIWAWAISFALALASFLLIYLLRGYNGVGFGYIALSDALVFPGICLLAFVVMIFVNRTGVFDILGYSFFRLFESFKQGNPKSYKDVMDYSDHKKEKRLLNKPYYLPYLVIGGLMLITGLIFAILGHYSN